MLDLNRVRKCYGYIRVSTLQQVTEGVSLDNQRDEIIRWADYNKIKVRKIFDDAGYSGSSFEERTGLMGILNILGKRDVLIAYSLDRLSRSIGDAIIIAKTLQKKEAHLVLLRDNINTTTPVGEFYFHLMGALAQLEVAQTAERVKVGMLRLKHEGRAVGPPPYGYCKRSFEQGSGLMEVPEEQEVIKLMRELREQGNSYNKIAKELNNRKIPPPNRAAEWYGKTINDIIKRYNVPTGGRYDNVNFTP